MSDKIKSRKFWFALVGAIMPLVAAAMTEEVAWNEAIMGSVALIMSYIFGQGYVDGQKEKSKEIKEEVKADE